jgi:hypothetical protein
MEVRMFFEGYGGISIEGNLGTASSLLDRLLQAYTLSGGNGFLYTGKHGVGYGRGMFESLGNIG